MSAIDSLMQLKLEIADIEIKCFHISAERRTYLSRFSSYREKEAARKSDPYLKNLGSQQRSLWRRQRDLLKQVTLADRYHAGPEAMKKMAEKSRMFRQGITAEQAREMVENYTQHFEAKLRPAADMYRTGPEATKRMDKDKSLQHCVGRALNAKFHQDNPQFFIQKAGISLDDPDPKEKKLIESFPHMDLPLFKATFKQNSEATGALREALDKEVQRRKDRGVWV